MAMITCITCGYWIAQIGDQCEACYLDTTERHPQDIQDEADYYQDAAVAALQRRWAEEEARSGQ